MSQTPFTYSGGTLTSKTEFHKCAPNISSMWYVQVCVVDTFSRARYYKIYQTSDMVKKRSTFPLVIFQHFGWMTEGLIWKLDSEKSGNKKELE